MQHFFFGLIFVLFVGALLAYLRERSHCRVIELKYDRLWRAYRELTESSALINHSILEELNAEKRVSDALIPTVEMYVKIIEETAALLKDDQPPSVATEKESIRLYHETRAHRKGNQEARSSDHHPAGAAAQPATGS